MKIDARLFPHPVLSHFAPEDFSNNVFLSELSILARRSVYRFVVNFMTDNRDLLELVDKKQARYVVHVECRSTRVRKIFKTFEDRLEFSIPADELEGHVQICSFILAAEDIQDYNNSSLHSDYDEQSFSINKGDLLAVAPDQSFSAQKENDPLKQVPSIFAIGVTDEKDAPPFDYNADDDKVEIILSLENFERYKVLSEGQQFWPILSSIFILPVLTLLVEGMKDPETHEENGDRRWFIVLNSKLEALGITITNTSRSSIQLAQLLIGDLAIVALKNLETLGMEEEQETV